MDNERQLSDDIKEYQKRIGENIYRICKEKNIPQSRIREVCKEAGFSLSQSTVSNAVRGENSTISNLLAIAYALDVNITELLDITHAETVTIDKTFAELDDIKKSDLFISDPNSVFLKGYMGDFHTLFFKTSGSADEIVRGKMHISPNAEGTGCTATLTLPISDIDPETGKPAEKIYTGSFFVSQSMRACYYILKNDRTAEISMIITQYIYTTYGDISTIMGLAITTASGANRLPTVHRISLSRKYADKELLLSIKGQLLMNTADIIIDNSHIDHIWRNNNIPLSFRELLLKVSAKYPCFCIPEASLYDSSLSEEDQLKYISLVRAESKSPKYSKISRKTDDALFSLFGGKG